MMLSQWSCHPAPTKLSPRPSSAISSDQHCNGLAAPTQLRTGAAFWPLWQPLVRRDGEEIHEGIAGGNAVEEFAGRDEQPPRVLLRAERPLDARQLLGHDGAEKLDRHVAS